jgi:hypothetical protein
MLNDFVMAMLFVVGNDLHTIMFMLNHTSIIFTRR